MKIVNLQIYGYGQLENVNIPNLKDFQVFFGENEAGKSTVMSFIHGIFFGFPTKQQSAELRYEPKNGAKYGGKITILHEEHGLVVIERIKGKATGDVKVLLPDGTIGGEDLLKELLSNFDKSLYQAIFSFNLHGLQNIHQMKGEEIGKFLFSAGALGTDRLALTENTLQKETDMRFKPGGRKPVLNEMLHELHELNGELKKASAKNKDFEVFIEKREQLQQELGEISNSIKDLQEYSDKLREWKKIHLLVKEEKVINSEIAGIGTIHFPVRGIERLEQLNQLLHPCNAQIVSMKERIVLLEKEIAALSPNLAFLENEGQIIALIEQIPLYEQWSVERNQLETKLNEFEEKLEDIKEKLHLPFLDKEISNINTNIYMKDRVEKISRKTLKLREIKEELEERFQEEKTKLEELEKDIRAADGQLLSDDQRTNLEKQLYEKNDKRLIEIEWESVKEKIEFLQQANEQEKKVKKQKQQMFIVIELFVVGILLYGLLTKEWILLLSGIAGGIIIAIFLTKGTLLNSTEKTESLNRLKQREQKLAQKLQTSEFSDLTSIENRIQLDNKRREHLQVIKIKLEQQQNQYEKVISHFESWELESSKNKENLLEISKELKIPIKMAASYLLESFRLLEQYKSIERDKKQIIDKFNQVTLQQKKVTDGLKYFSDLHLSDRDYSLHKTAILLRQKLKEEEEKQIQSKEKNLKLKELSADLEQKELEKQHLQLEILRLYQSAGVEDETQFYELSNKYEKQGKLSERLKDIQAQLQFSLLSESEREVFLNNHHFEQEILESTDKIQILEERKHNIEEQLASIKYELQVLEEGGVYTDLLHQFKQKKYELEEAAKEWAVLSLAQDILKKTIERYKETHLPRMLAKAEEYLYFLTDGNYRKIHLRETGTGFLIERNDYTVFEANELSQATTEQVYVAIRFALATTLYEKYHFPIIIDDSFVNFDQNRTMKVIELLKKLKNNQILFFTCHAHLLSYFQKENILSLEKGAIEIHL